jgi:ABC-type Fe3+-hydroxamate transport system substrate-binding protein
MLIAVALCAACRDAAPRAPASQPAPIEVADDAGRTVRLNAPAERILSLVPAQTGILLELGVRERLIARTAFDVQPELAGLPSIGNALTPNLEWIAARQPDLVISWADAQSRSVVARLAQLGIAAYASSVESIDDIERSVQRLGALTGRTHAADSIVARMRARLDSVRGDVARYQRRGVLYVIGIDPTMAAGPHTFVDEAITIAGGDNVFADAAGRWPLVSMEEIVRRDPDVIVLATTPDRAAADALIARLRTDPGWRDLRAVQNGRVYWADPALFNRPAPSVADAARALALMLHGSGE